MASLPNILDWIYSGGFDEVTIPGEVLEAILNSVVVFESASESDSTFKSYGRAVTMWLVGNHAHFSCNYIGNNCTRNSQNYTRLYLMQF